jgi:hypothetical protein
MLPIGLAAVITLVLFFPLRALVRRVRTALWDPEVNDIVLHRTMRGLVKKTVFNIGRDGVRLQLQYASPYDGRIRRGWHNRSRVLFYKRPQPAQPFVAKLRTG